MAETKKTTEKVAETINKNEELVKVYLPIARGLEDDVFVSVNGHAYQIKRGVEVEVPRYIKEVLDNKERMERLAIERQRALRNK